MTKPQANPDYMIFIIQQTQILLQLHWQMDGSVHKALNSSVDVSILPHGQTNLWNACKKLPYRRSDYMYNCIYVVRRLQAGLHAQYYRKHNPVCNSKSCISTAPNPSTHYSTGTWCLHYLSLSHNNYASKNSTIMTSMSLIYKMHTLMYVPTTVGSKSTKTALGTCFPAPVSLKNVLKLSSPPPRVLSDGIWPSG